MEKRGREAGQKRELSVSFCKGPGEWTLWSKVVPEEGSGLVAGDTCKVLLSFWSLLRTQWVVMVMILLKIHIGGKSVKLEEKESYNLPCARLL